MGKKRSLILISSILGLFWGGFALFSASSDQADFQGVEAADTTVTIQYYPIFGNSLDKIGPLQSITVPSSAYMDAGGRNIGTTTTYAIPNTLWGYSATAIGSGWVTIYNGNINAINTFGTADTYKNEIIGCIFSGDSTVSTTSYTFDFSCALSDYSSSDYVYAEYSDGTNTGYASLGKGLNGVGTASIPSTATSVTLSSFTLGSDNSYTAKGSSTSISISPSSTPNEVFLTGSKSGDDYVGYEADSGYIAIKNALSNLVDSCSTTESGASATEAMKSAWSTIASTTSNYKTNLASMPANEKAASKSIAQCLSLYDYLVKKYGNTLGDNPNPLSRAVSANSSLAYNLSSQEEASTYVAIGVMTGVSSLSILSFIFLKKKGKIA